MPPPSASCGHGPVWNVINVLKDDICDGRCVGQAVSRGRRCRNPIKASNVAEARRRLHTLPHVTADPEKLQSELKEVATLTLCTRYHVKVQEQVDQVVKNWTGKIKLARLEQRNECLPSVGAENQEDQEQQARQEQHTRRHDQSRVHRIQLGRQEEEQDERRQEQEDVARGEQDGAHLEQEIRQQEVQREKEDQALQPLLQLLIQHLREEALRRHRQEQGERRRERDRQWRREQGRLQDEDAARVQSEREQAEAGRRANTEAEEDVPCGICLEKLGSYGGRTTLACSHTFCDECIVTWFLQSQRCPYRCDRPEANGDAIP